MTITRRMANGGLIESRIRGYWQEPQPWGTVLKLDRTQADTVFFGNGFPDYKHRIANHQSATTILTGERHSQRALQDGYGFVHRESSDSYWDSLSNSFKKQWYEYSYRGSLGLDVSQLDDPGSIFISSVKNSVVQSIVRQIRESQTALRGLVSAGEMGETLRMMRSRGRTFQGGLHRYLDTVKNLGRNLRGRSLRELMRDVEDTLLEYNLGWKPLISDIHDGAKALSRVVTYHQPRTLVRHANETTETVSLGISLRSNGPLIVKCTRELRARYGCKIYGCVVASQPGAVIQLDQFGLNFNEFIPTLWELIPYSFIVDYFSNVGAVIDAYSLNSLGVAWLNIGELKAYELTSTPELSIQTPPAGHRDVDSSVNAGSPYQYSRSRVHRDSFSIGDLTPTLEFRIPGTSTQWLNMAALVGAGSRTSRFLSDRFGRRK